MNRCLLCWLIAIAVTGGVDPAGRTCAAQEVVPLSAGGGRVEQHLRPGSPQRRIVVRLPSAQPTYDGELSLEPSVSVTADEGSAAGGGGAYGLAGQLHGPASPLASVPGDGTLPQALPPVTGRSPEDLPWPGPGDAGLVDPMFNDLIQQWPTSPCGPCGSSGLFRGGTFGDGEGVAKPRLSQALFLLEPAQPEGNFRVRIASYRGHEYPDRAEIFWARTVQGRGPPLPETSVDYQELRLRMELGSERFSTVTEVPFRWTNPEINSNHAGLGDINLKLKTVFLDGEDLQITFCMGNYFQSGAPSMGLGTGHYSLEPGFLFRHRWRENMWLHAEIKYLIPFGNDPAAKGQVLGYGLGVNRLLWESDYFGIIPSLEFAGWSVSDGLQTSPLGIPLSADGENMFHLVPGVHFVHDSGCDAGLVEIGISAEFALARDRWYDSSILFDLRWSW